VVTSADENTAVAKTEQKTIGHSRSMTAGGTVKQNRKRREDVTSSNILSESNYGDPSTSKRIPVMAVSDAEISTIKPKKVMNLRSKKQTKDLTPGRSAADEK